MKNTRDKVIEQIELMDNIRDKANINIVTCGNCGSIVLHERNEEDIDCPYCPSVMAQSDCPDYLYVGIENNNEFNK